MSTNKNDKNRQHFVNKVSQKYSDRSYYTRHILAYKFTYSLGIFFGVLSGVAGLTGSYSILAKNVFGIDDTLLNSLSNNVVLSLLILCIAIPCLFFIESLKRHFHTDGLEENLLVTDDRGKFELRVAIFISILSVIISGYGGYLIANERAGTKDSQVIAAIKTKYDTKKESLKHSISTLDTSIVKIDNSINEYKTNDKYQNGQGKILYKWIEKIGNLESDKTSFVTQKTEFQKQLTDIENEIKTEQIKAGVYHKIGLLMDSKATENTILFMVFLQIFFDVCIYLCLRFTVKFEYKVGEEEGNINKQVSQSHINDNNILDSEININTSPVYNRNEIGFKIPNSKQTINKQQTEVSENVVTHNTQQKNKVLIVGNYSKVRNNMMNNYSRLLKSYTEKRYKNVKDGIEYFCSIGLKCWIDENNKLNAENLNEGTLKKNNVLVNWDDKNKLLTIKYY